ncbi:cytochrome p450 [Hirsutella rhossiliensis]|uniref:Cytochrome p450 domain-containing protein n=1 Tax=Hirsutella rhossiliensis TaxID=111463 RepID=A0A9P8MLQ5_9HYPO|nr:cytochrome p450 domain-containing protein [Hirsutella rhossiliensis]KAH0957324.1 cytochrome p450 domain-containing protein [Hirsutella rhossiliensis]
MGLVEVVLEHVSIKSVALVILVALVLRLVLARVDEHRRIKRLGNYGPTIKNYAPLGIDFMVRSIRAYNRNEMLKLWFDHYFGPTGSWTVETRLVNQRLIFTADPENMKAMLATQFGDYGKGEDFHREWKEFLGDSIFTTDGAQWQSSRQLIRPQFTRDRVSDLDCFESHVETLFQAMANGGPLDGSRQGLVDLSQSHGRVIEISNLFYRYTLDVATDFLLGADVKSLSTPKQEFAEAFDEVQRIQCIMNRTSKFRFLFPKSRYRACLRVVNDFVHKFIDRALRLTPEELEAKDKNYTFLHELARFSRDPQFIRDQIVAVLLAGRDTTAGTLSWAIYELARHPAAVARLRTEILETVGSDRAPTYEHLKNMPYLKAVLNETLRLYPAVPFNLRRALVDTTLPRGGGPDGSEPLPVLKGTPIGYSPLVMQRRPDLFPPASDSLADPAVFSPERWANWHPRPHDYIPFNAGPRICIGQQFALTEMSYVLCRMFQRFARVESHMQPIDGGEPAIKIDITVTPAKGVRVAFYENE